MVYTVVALVLLGVLLVAGEIWRSSRVRFRRLEIPLEGAALGAEEEITVLHLSDMHVTAPSAGRLTQLSFLTDKSWDLVIISGDLIDDDSGVEPVCELIGSLRARCGKYAVLGNHDYHRIEYGNPFRWIKMFWMAAVLGKPQKYVVPNDVEKLTHALDNIGVVLLRNDMALGKLASGRRYQVFGIDDPSTRRDNPEPLHGRADPAALRLAITHSPRRIGRIAPLRPAMVFCGHTHGGQVRLPLIGALATHSDAGRKKCGGLVELDGCRVHISPGFGAGRLFPVRFLSRCEVTEIVLKAPECDKQRVSG